MASENMDENRGPSTERSADSSEAVLDELGKSDPKKELLKLVLIGLVALCVFTVFNTWPSIYTAVGGVLVVCGVAKGSEWASVQGERVPYRKRAVLVTGCDKGFGHALAVKLDLLGATVFACCLEEESEGARKLKENGSDRMHVLKLDVTDNKTVSECFGKVCKILDGSGLWGLVNNAGLNIIGDIELTTMEQFERTSNINMLGVVRVTKAFLPLIRKAKGRVVNVTSVKGIVSEPQCAAYAMTKFAIETFSDILRMEMRKFAVRVSIIEPGNFGGATASLEIGRIKNDLNEMWHGMTEELKECYGKEYVDENLIQVEKAIPTSAMDISPVIDSMVDALFSLQPKARYRVPGGKSFYDHHFWRARLCSVLPESIADGLWLHDLRGWPMPEAVVKDPTLGHAH